MSNAGPIGPMPWVKMAAQGVVARLSASRQVHGAGETIPVPSCAGSTVSDQASASRSKLVDGVVVGR